VLNAMAAVAVAWNWRSAGHPERRDVQQRSRRRVRGRSAASRLWTTTGTIRRNCATLDGALLCGFRRVHVLFQPHRYTRTFHLMDEFARSFHQADNLFVMDIYAASEQPIEGVSAEALVDRIRQFGHRAVEGVGTIDRGVDALLGVARDGDLVLTLGAGSVWQAGEGARD
jgi:UDP-N-acetylmuramate--alanine ligase